MATGPEHYMLAENALLTALIDGIPAQDVTKLQLDGIGRAILALAAAVGTFGGDEARSREDYVEWERVAGEFTRQAPIRAANEARERAEEQAARDAESADDADGNAGPHREHPHCEGCPDCIGYTDPNEPDDEGAYYLSEPDPGDPDYEVGTAAGNCPNCEDWHRPPWCGDLESTL